MGKNNKLVLVLQAMIAALTITGCGNTGSNTSNSTTSKTEVSSSSTTESHEDVTVTFDLNYENSPAATTQKVAYDDVAEKPSDPVREHYAFKGWYNQAACTNKFDFEEALTEDVTAYAGWTKTEAVVTFDNNYEGASTSEVVVTLNDKVSAITQPTRDGYNFTNWYSDAACTTAYDFTADVTDDFTLYAGWAQKSSDDITLTYLWNYEGAENNGVAVTKTITKNKRGSSETVSRDGYYFVGWYTEAACTTAFDFNTRIQEDTTFYAKWLKGYTFEGEYTDLSGVNGSTYSGGAGETGLILKDGKDSKNTLGASNGYYLANMYSKGCTITFSIVSDSACDDAVLVLRLGAEYFDISFSDEDFLVQVNGENLSYTDISITNVPSYSSGEKKEFADFTINKAVSLAEGTNTIKLIVNNDRRMQESGTLNATAPMVDCMYIYTDSVLSYTPKTSNLDYK